MLTDWFWSLIRETATGKNKRQKKMKCMFSEFFFFLVRILYIET